MASDADSAKIMMNQERGGCKMITITSDFTPELRNDLTTKKYQPSWYRDERYDYVEQAPAKKASRRSRISFFRKHVR